jgi:hypothetical protein
MRQRSARADFIAFEERGRWRTPLPPERQVAVPWVFVSTDRVLISPFADAPRKRLSYSEASAVQSMQEQLHHLRCEGRLPRGTVWIWPDGREPERIEAGERWLRQRRAHCYSVYA